MDTVMEDGETFELKPYIRELDDPNKSEELIELKEVIPDPYEEVLREGSNVPITRRPLIWRRFL